MGLILSRGIKILHAACCGQKKKKRQRKKRKVNMKAWVMKLLSYDLVVINIQKIDHILKTQLIAANENLTHF